MDPTLRAERPGDVEAIHAVNLAAFGQPAEATLVNRLRETGNVRVSLVAELEGQVVGHVLFSAIHIAASKGDLPALALAPVAVDPAFQRRGIGSALIRAGLVRAGLDACRRQGERIVIVLGEPAYYGRFGFSAALAVPLECDYAGEYFQALELAPGALSGITGRVVYSAPFGEL